MPLACVDLMIDYLVNNEVLRGCIVFLNFLFRLFALLRIIKIVFFVFLSPSLLLMRLPRGLFHRFLVLLRVRR